MVRQSRYIFQAALLLTGCTLSFLLIKKIPPELVKEESSFFCGTESLSMQKLSPDSDKGQMLFRSNCASCHILFKDATGPDLARFEERGPWSNRQNVYKWIRNPSAFMKTNDYAKNLKKTFGSEMTAFPAMTNEEIDAICFYISTCAVDFFTD